MAQYVDFYKAVEDILAHVRKTGHQIVPDDRPMELSIGFACEMEPEECWHIRITNLRLSLGVREDTRVLRTYLMGTSGRQELAAGFSRGQCIWQDVSPP